MKEHKPSLSEWLLGKIMMYLETKEGCTEEDQPKRYGSPTGIVRDVFGNRYEVTVKYLGKIQDADELFKVPANLDFTGVVGKTSTGNEK